MAAAPTFDQILQSLRPGAAYSNLDGTLGHVTWAPGVSAPTQQEFDAAQAALDNPVPHEVMAGQLIRSLDQLGLLATIDAAVAQADALTQRLWGRAATFPRNDPLLVSFAQGIGKTPAELDNIFRLAATL
jgi:hypothetical protein